MTNTEIKTLFASKKNESFNIDPMHKNEIQRQTITAIDRSIQKALSSKKSVTVVIFS